MPLNRCMKFKETRSHSSRVWALPETVAISVPCSNFVPLGCRTRPFGATVDLINERKKLDTCQNEGLLR